MDGFMGFSQTQVFIAIVLLIIVAALVYTMRTGSAPEVKETGPVPDTEKVHEEDDD